MRTTLKRGIGRAAGPDGNGNSALPPLFGPVTRYKQPDPPRRPLTKLLLRGLGWFVLLLAVVGAGVGGGIYLYVHETLNDVKAHTKQVVRAQKELKVPKTSKAAIALIAGYDHRAGSGSNAYAGSNSDTLMLVRADPKTQTVSLFSLPRDLAVNIYCHGNTVYTQNRINAAWAECGGNGPAAALDTVEHFTGLPINYFITLDFRAFKEIVNRLHGVYMNVDQRYYNPLHTGYSAINLHPGYQKLDGGQALSYVRFRHLDSDLYRVARQQLFVEALKARLRTALSVFDIPKLIGALKQNIEVGRGGGGSPTLGEIEAYAGILLHLPAGHLIRVSIPISDYQTYITPGGADELKVSPTALEAAIHRFLHPHVATPGIPGAKKPAHKKKTKTPTLPKKDVSVLVLNASNVAGAAANTTYLLTQQGFATHTLPATVPADAPSLTHDTIVYYDPVQPHAKEAAEELEPLFGAHTRIQQITSAIAGFAAKAHNPQTIVSVGTSFSGTLKTPHKAKSHKLPPPEVTDGVPVVAGPVRAIAHQAHFPLMIPNRIALGSAISTGEGVRLFKPLRGRQELAVTFNVNGGAEYWQIEESDWNTAPVFQGASYKFVHEHKTYWVFTSGGAVQMVVLRTAKASYAVVNGLLNQLSNSTMIAIAESLHPLGR